MKLPILEEQFKEKEICEEFLGYCRKLRISPKQWFFQRNMTNDCYPAASSRKRRALQSQNGAITFSLAQNGETSSYTASKTLGACYSSGNLYILKTLENSADEIIGCAFIKNGELALDEEETVAAASSFIISDKKRSLVRMGSKICVFPDGVIFETGDGEIEKSVYPIETEITFDDFLLSTVVKNRFGNYEDICEYDDENYRIENNCVQQYIEESGTWVNKETMLKLSALKSDNMFEKLSVNDCVYIYTEGSPGLHSDISGSVVFKKYDEYQNPQAYKILEKGEEEVNGADLEYIIFSGYIVHDISNKSYINASTFEIRQHLYNYQSDVGSLMILRRKVPDIKFAFESQNRIWACSGSGHEIYASSLGNPMNFYDFSGLSTDSYSVNVGTDGEFTACANYMGRPVFFKENAVHIINGSYPSNGGELDGLSYSVTSSSDFQGVEKGSEESLCVINNILYYKSNGGIIAYDTTAATVISDALGYEKYKNAVAGAVNGKYYVCMEDESHTPNLFVFDTELGMWSREDEISILQFLNVKGNLLFIRESDGAVFSVDRGDVLNSGDYEEEGMFEWECETGEIGFEYSNNKYISRIQLRMKLEGGAGASIFVMYDSDGVWRKKGEINSRGIKTHLIPIIPVRCDHMRFKIKGIGDAKIISFARIIEEGGDSV